LKTKLVAYKVRFTSIVRYGSKSAKSPFNHFFTLTLVASAGDQLKMAPPSRFPKATENEAANAMLRNFKMNFMYKLLDTQTFQMLTLVTASFLCVMFVPHTKVEESFQMQAVHDFLFIGLRNTYRSTYNALITGDPNGDPEAFVRNLNETRGVSNPWFELLTRPRPVHYELWDHEEFPGVVPRTFIGPFFIAAFQWPLAFFQNRRKWASQFASRLLMAIFVMFGYSRFLRSIGRRYGRYTRNMLLMLTVSQFHFSFYASRLLPNTFALALQLLAYSAWLDRRWNRFITLSAFTVVVFRFDSALMFGLIMLYEHFYTRQLSLYRVFRVGIPSGLLAVACTVAFDSYFWGRLTFPELESFYFNVWKNQSHLWGVQPFYWYFTSVVPRMLLFSLPLIFFASKRITIKIAPVAFAFLFLYSFLPHKELRFVMAVMPLLNALAASALSVVFMRFEVVDKMPESWLYNAVNAYFGGEYVHDAYDERFAEQEKRELDEERQAEERRRRRVREPTHFDALETFNSDYDPSAADTLMIPTGRNVRRRHATQRDATVQQIVPTPTASPTTSGDQSGSNRVQTRNRSAASGRGRQSSSRTTRSTRSDSQPIEDLEPILQTMMNRVSIKLLILFSLLSIHLCFNMAAALYMSYVSSHNYPGGDAMTWLSKSIQIEMGVNNGKPHQLVAHIDNLVAQTGYTRFLEVPGVRYDKTPDFLDRDLSICSNKTRRHHSLNVDFSQYKTSYMLFEAVGNHFLRRYCPSSERTVGQGAQEFNYQKLTCDFDAHNRDCRLFKLVDGYVGIQFTLDAHFMSVEKGPMIYLFRCTIKP
jgi:hypothetical protein